MAKRQPITPPTTPEMTARLRQINEEIAEHAIAIREAQRHIFDLSNEATLLWGGIQQAEARAEIDRLKKEQDNSDGGKAKGRAAS